MLRTCAALRGYAVPVCVVLSHGTTCSVDLHDCLKVQGIERHQHADSINQALILSGISAVVRSRIGARADASAPISTYCI